MSLDKEIKKARTEVVADGYDMSVGEIINLYRDEEIFINPAFQRLFRWDLSRKSRFIESLLLGIPIPPIFIYQRDDGVWELIDGLQRLSTIFEFVGVLRLSNGVTAEPSELSGTIFLPSLANKKWEPSSSGAGNSIGKFQQLQIKRARMRVEILKPESDPKAKFELFQRLNTGGVDLSEQEVRNCIAVMINRDFSDWLGQCSKNSDFLKTIAQTKKALKKQIAVELALRFFVFRNISYDKRLDVHEYLDHGLVEIASDPDFDIDHEGDIFNRTFGLLAETMGSNAFKRWDGASFKGMFLMSVFEVIAVGVSKYIDKIEKLGKGIQKKHIMERCKSLWVNPTFQRNSGAGVRGTTRLTNLLPMAEEYFKK